MQPNETAAMNFLLLRFALSSGIMKPPTRSGVDSTSADEPRGEGRGSATLISRRRFMLGAAALGALAAGGYRLVGYRHPANWSGRVLRDWEVDVVVAAAAALIPDIPGGTWPSGPPPEELARNIDRYLLSLPPALLREIRGLLVFLEHGTWLTLHWPRFTRLSPTAAAAHLQRLHARAGVQRLVVNGMRDLCMSAWYQDPRTWPALGYEGPMVLLPAGTERRRDGLPRRPGRYDRLVAGTPLGSDPLSPPPAGSRTTRAPVDPLPATLPPESTAP
jgi:hypothetical protein